MNGEHDVAILCHLERLGPKYEAGWTYFGLNLSAALVASAVGTPGTATKQDLELWRHKIAQDDGIELWLEKQDGTAGPIDPVDSQLEVVDHPAPLPDADKQRLVDLLHGELHEADTVATWDPADSPAQDGENDRVFRNVLGYVSTLPAPLPQSVGISLVFRVQDGVLEDGAKLFAAPHVVLLDEGNRIFSWTPGDSGPAALTDSEYQERVRLHRWGYVEDPAGRRNPAAYLAPFDLEQAQDPDAFFDFASHWIRKPGGNDHCAGEDWLTRLEDRAADAFDLPRHMVDGVLEAVVENNPGHLDAFRNAFLAALRDRADLGARERTDGGSLVRDVLRRILPGEADADLRRAVEAALETYDQSLALDAWRDLVQTALPDLADLSVLALPPGRVEDERGHFDRLYQAFEDEASLRRLVLAQWGAALDSAAEEPVRRFWRENRAQVDALLHEMPLGKRLARANLAHAWTRHVILPGKVDDQEALGNNFRQLLLCYAELRLHLPIDPQAPTACQDFDLGPRPRTPDAPPGGWADGLEGRLRDHLRSFANAYVEDRLLPPKARPGEENFGPGTATDLPHALTLQVDRLGSAADDGSVEDVEDLLRRIAGVGILMRREGSTWRCLNMAHPVLARQEIQRDVLAPLRLVYERGQRQALVTYDNQPLVAESPAVGLAADLELKGREGTDLTQLLGYVPALRRDEDGESYESTEWSKLPGLAFGKTYEVAPFLIGNSGALPAELANGHPAKLRDTPEGLNVPGDLVRKVPYLRRVRVGRPHWVGVDPQGRPDKSSLPAIPADVTPLAGELPETVDHDEFPLLLLHASRNPAVPERSAFTFQLRKPPTSLQTWDRWRAAEAGGAKDVRIDVWADYHRTAQQNRLATREEDRVDLSLDDPAVEREMLVELIPRRAAGSEESLRVATRPSGAPAEEIEHYRDLPITVICQLLEEGPPPESRLERTGPSTVRVWVHAGEVWELRVHALVRTSWFDDEEQRRFHPAARNLTDEEGNPWKDENDEPVPRRSVPLETGASAYVFDPVRLLVEGADLTPLTGESLPRELYRTVEPAVRGDRVFLTLDRPAFSQADVVDRLEIYRQLWRWEGRPLDEFQFGKPETWRRWELQGFPTRRDEDRLVTSSPLRLREGSNGLPKILFEEDLSHDPRARYMRFGARAFHRYRGLLPRAEASVEAYDAKTFWKRLSVSCRYSEPVVPKPAVKLVVPLTEAGKEGQTPGLLVVLNEPWYEVGGLAERLEARVEIVKVPSKEEETRPDELPQFGPDPIRTGLAWNGDAPEPELHGPIGHTFDTDAEAPLFVASSFVLRFEHPQPLEGHLAKVRFRRELVAAGTVGGGRESPWTCGYWVQLLDDARCFGLTDVEQCYVEELEGEPDVFRIRHRETGEPIEPVGTTRGFRRTYFVAVATRTIHDVRGREDEEFAGLYEWQNDRFERIPGTGSSSMPTEGDLCVRLLEIEEREGGMLKTVEEKLFGEKPEENQQGPKEADAEARVFRFSPPIHGKRSE